LQPCAASWYYRTACLDVEGDGYVFEGELPGRFEEHSPAGIRAALDASASPVDRIDGRRPIDILIEVYLRIISRPIAAL